MPQNKNISAIDVYNDIMSGQEVAMPETDDFLEMALMDSDRGCLLAMAAFLDDALAAAIRRRLIELSGTDGAEIKKDLDILLDKRPLPPLGSFGVRITMCRVLGIIDSRTRSVLAAFQELRNKNAHSWASFKFSESNLQKIEAAIGMTESEQFVREVEKSVAVEVGREFPTDQTFWKRRLINITLRVVKSLAGPFPGVLE